MSPEKQAIIKRLFDNKSITFEEMMILSQENSNVVFVPQQVPIQPYQPPMPWPPRINEPWYGKYEVTCTGSQSPTS